MSNEIQNLFKDFKNTKEYTWPSLDTSQQYFVKENHLCGDKVYLWNNEKEMTLCKPCGCQILYYSCTYLKLYLSNQNQETFITEYTSFKKNILSQIPKNEDYIFLEKKIHDAIFYIQQHLPMRIPCILLPWDAYLEFLQNNKNNSQ